MPEHKPDSKQVSDLVVCARYVLKHWERAGADIGEVLAVADTPTSDTGGYWDVGLVAGLDLVLGADAIGGFA